MSKFSAAKIVEFTKAPQSPNRTPTDANRLVVVSNRVADPNKSDQAGGLAVAILDALKARDGMWFGWSGAEDENASSNPVEHWLSDGIAFATVDLTPAERTGYYLGHANDCLWPLFHYRTDLMRFDRANYATYLEVNRRMARALSPLLKPSDFIWVHDYHLVPLANELRRLGHQNAIGFFLHIPFPPGSVLKNMPEYAQLIDELSAFDLVGLQTNQDREHLEACIRERGALALGRSGHHAFNQRLIKIGVYPVGINVEEFTQTAEANQQHQLPQGADAPALIIGVDRLDYSKGIEQRFQAYGQLLKRYPDCNRKVTFLQIAARSRDDIQSYCDTRHDLDRIVGDIEGEYAQPGWNPVCYIRRAVPREVIAGLYRASRVGFVMPLRDGMNLVAKEFVAAQDPNDPGVLVLSQFAGAAEDLTEAVIVNPHDPDGVADGLHKALTMSLEERKARHKALMTKLHAHSAANWRTSFLTALSAMSIPEMSFDPLRRSAS